MKTLNEDFPPLKPMAPELEKAAGYAIRGVHKKLMQARIELQGRKLNKSGHNKFAGYNYFELGDFLPTVQQIFSDLGLCGVISYGKDEAWLTITDTEDGSSLAVCSPMSEANLKGCHPVQNLGAVQTYVRRYLWVTAMEIVEHDALDSTTGKKDAKPEVDDELAEFAESKASQVRALFAKSDIEGAASILNMLGVNGSYDSEAKEIVWGRLESNIRSAIKAYDAISQARTLDALKKAWDAAPVHSKTLLEAAKDKRKGELSQEKEAA